MSKVITSFMVASKKAMRSKPKYFLFQKCGEVGDRLFYLREELWIASRVSPSVSRESTGVLMVN